MHSWPKGYKRYRSKNGCVRNAWMLASDHPDELRLVKGYALEDGGLWLGHWWCVDSQDRVIDPTWKNDGLAYIGVEVVDIAEYAKRMLDEDAWVLEVPQIALRDLAEELERARLGVE